MTFFLCQLLLAVADYKLFSEALIQYLVVCYLMLCKCKLGKLHLSETASIHQQWVSHLVKMKVTQKNVRSSLGANVCLPNICMLYAWGLSYATLHLFRLLPSATSVLRRLQKSLRFRIGRDRRNGDVPLPFAGLFSVRQLWRTYHFAYRTRLQSLNAGYNGTQSRLLNPLLSNSDLTMYSGVT